jgi:uncharacterized protein YicC (UPF0701 family)
VGRTAETLETAAKASDLAGVQERHAAFVALVETLLDSLDKILGEGSVANDRPLAAEPDAALLAELRDACKAFDMDRVDAAMAQLESSRYERGEELVRWLREKVDAMEFEEIAGMTVIF